MKWAELEGPLATAAGHAIRGKREAAIGVLVGLLGATVAGPVGGAVAQAAVDQFLKALADTPIARMEAEGKRVEAERERSALLRRTFAEALEEFAAPGMSELAEQSQEQFLQLATLLRREFEDVRFELAELLRRVSEQEAVAVPDGREHIDDLLALAAQGEQTVVLATGGAQSGKSTFLDLVAAKAVNQGALVARVRCTEDDPRFGVVQRLVARLNDSLRTRPGGAAALNLGSIRFLCGDGDGARADYERARKVATEGKIYRLIWRAWHNLGNTYLAANQLDEARRAFDEALLEVERAADEFVGEDQERYLATRLAPYKSAILVALRRKNDAQAERLAKAHPDLPPFLDRQRRGSRLEDEEQGNPRFRRGYYLETE